MEPVDKEVAEKQGFSWKENEQIERAITLPVLNIPDDIADVPDSLANEVSHAHGTTACPQGFETPYAPDRPEIIYCEECYKAETI